MMARDSMVKYGDIQLASSGESVEELIKQIDVLIKKHGYPGSVSLNDVEDEIDEFEEDEENGMDGQDEGEDDETRSSNGGSETIEEHGGVVGFPPELVKPGDGRS